MKVSVVTVAFNAEATISETLNSVRQQNHANLEHVVVDGGSIDRTLDFAKRLLRPGGILHSESDEGIYDAMNKGLQLASGDWVGFLNADDTFADANVASDMVKVIQEEAADIVYGDLDYVLSAPPHNTVRRWRSGPYSPNQLAWGWMPPHPTFYVRRSLVERLGEFDARYKIAADYDFMLRYLRSPGVRVVYLPRVLVKMKTGGASNRSFDAMLLKSREDYRVLKRNGVGGVMSLIAKNLRKLPQFF